MKNVTVTMEEATLEWVRVKAARENSSVARYLGQLVEQARSKDGAYDRAMRRALQFREVPMPAPARYLTRDEVNDRRLLRAADSADLR